MRTDIADLCTKCSLAPTCLRRLREHEPVSACDNFLCHCENISAQLEALGICGACHRRVLCTRRNGEGGIWQCTDYE